MVNAVAVTQAIQSSSGLPIPRPLAELRLGSLQASRKRVLFVSSELADLVKVGGLGDVSSALPKALNAHHDVRALIPGYRQVLESGHAYRVIGQIPGHAALPPCSIGRMDLPDGLIVYVLICPELYDRDGGPYGDANGRDWADNHIRFARLALAATEIASGTACLSWCPDLVHANDWTSALTPAYMSWRGLRTPTVFTIHNLAYQGVCDMGRAPELGIPGEALNHEGMEFYGKLSLLKAGLVYASHVTTVSPNYAHEITTTDFGCGLDGLLRSCVRQGRLSGILNGIDTSWDPREDDHLLAGFSAADLAGKQVNAQYVRETFGLGQERPLFAVVSRLVQQKGIDLTIAEAEQIVAAGGSIAAIGRGEPELEQAMRDLAARHPGRIGVNVGFNETDARRMYAGSDFLLMPSRFEPCGLSQTYAQCFGSLPIARRTGGLADTIEDGLNGFLFDEPTVDSYLGAVRRAIEVYRHPELLGAMRKRAMAAPLYWERAIEPYNALYQSLLGGQRLEAPVR